MLWMNYEGSTKEKWSNSFLWCVLSQPALGQKLISKPNIAGIWQGFDVAYAVHATLYLIGTESRGH